MDNIFDHISQVLILVIGGAAIWLVSRLEEWKRWGYILGLISQPFWFYTTWKHSQWGLFILSVWYTYSWGLGVYNYWILPKKKA